MIRACLFGFACWLAAVSGLPQAPAPWPAAHVDAGITGDDPAPHDILGVTTRAAELGAVARSSLAARRATRHIARPPRADAARITRDAATPPHTPAGTARREDGRRHVWRARPRLVAGGDDPNDGHAG